MRDIVKGKIDEMNNYLKEMGINGVVNYNINNQLQLELYVHDITVRQLHLFLNKFNVYYEEEPNMDESLLVYRLNCENLLKEHFQLDVTQDDCKGEGIKLYRNSDKYFPTKDLENKYLTTCPSEFIAETIIHKYTEQCLKGESEDKVHPTIKYKIAPQIKGDLCCVEKD